MLRFGMLLSGLLVCSFSLLAQEPKSKDWPGFRGAKRDNVSTDTGLLKGWPKDGPKQVWKCEGIGIGYSSVAVVGDQVFTMGDVDRTCYLFAIHRGTGEQLWKTKVGRGGGNYEGPRCTPTVDGEFVYGLGQNGDLVCLTCKEGKEVWRKSLTSDFKGSAGGWNYTESPLIDGDKLVCTPGGSEASMLALNKKTGQVIWKGIVPDGDQAGYSSIVIAEIGKVRQYVQLMADGLVSFSANKGTLLWRFGNQNNRFGGNTANIPTPIIKGNLIFASAGYGRGGALIEVTGSGTKFNTKELYWRNELNNKHGGVLLVGDSLFGDRDDSGRPWCADFKTGKVKWSREERSKGSGSASMTYADGHLYIRYSNGWVALVDAKAKEYKEISTFKLPNGESDCWAHPVVIDGKLYLRERDILWCYDVSAKK